MTVMFVSNNVNIMALSSEEHCLLTGYTVVLKILLNKLYNF